MHCINELYMFVHRKSIEFWITHCTQMSSLLFKMDWLLMSIVILCVLAMGLYALINAVEKVYQKYF